MTQAISDALVPYGTIVQRDAAIAAALASYYTSAQTDSAIAAGRATIDLSPYWTIPQVQAAITAALVPVTLSNGQSWTGGPTFNLKLRGSNVLRNLSVAGAPTATFQNLDDTILIESDSYARSETYTQLETGAAITAALDALNLTQYRTEAQVLALIAGELVPYWDQSEVSSFVAGELSNYQTSSQVSAAISSALSSYDNSSQVDNKIITALLDFYTRAETDQAIANAVSAETQTYVANELLAYYPRTELDSQLTATFTQYWTSGRTQTEIDDALAGSGFLDQTAGDARYFVRAPGAESGQIWNLVQEQFTPRIVRDRRRHPGQPVHPAHPERLLVESGSGRPLPRYFPVAGGPRRGGQWDLQLDPNPAHSEDNQKPVVPNSLWQHPPDCWSKGQSDTRYPLIANFNSLGQRVTDLDNTGRGPRGGPHGQLANGHELRGHAPAAERSGRPADPKRPGDRLQGGRRPAGLRRRRHQPGPGCHGGRSERDDGGFRPAPVGMEVVSNLRVEAKLVRCDPARRCSPSRAPRSRGSEPRAASASWPSSTRPPRAWRGST